MFRNIDRRRFLRQTAGSGLAAVTALLPSVGRGSSPNSTSRSNIPQDPARRKLILVIFGGGTRASETIDDPEHRYIPRLWQEMIPRGTLFANMRIRHRVVHPNCTASIKTGHWEWDDLDWSKPPQHPTVFELVRKQQGAPDTAAWSFVYASILSKTGESSAAGFGRRFAANVVTPPTIPRSAAQAMDRLMARAAVEGSREAGLVAAAECARLARSASRLATDGLRSGPARRWLDEQYDAWKQAAHSTSHDAFLADLAIRSMQDFAPDVLSVDFGEIDCAHYGSWSRYVAAIRRTDELTWRLWRAAETLPEYRDRTLLLILPDHGRELDRASHSGFIHHSNFYTGEGADEGCRRVWMLALGPGLTGGKVIRQPVPITAAAATGLEYLGIESSPGSHPSVLSRVFDGMT
jgi:hypothetical protein